MCEKGRFTKRQNALRNVVLKTLRTLPGRTSLTDKVLLRCLPFCLKELAFAPKANHIACHDAAPETKITS
eukprot:2357728-Prymnesium_polylepis.6